jgi:hypothetical protein
MVGMSATGATADLPLVPLDSIDFLLTAPVKATKVRRTEFNTARLGALRPVMLATVLLLCSAACALAGTATLDFEGFPDSTILTTQYAGFTFSNAIILTAGISLNEFEFPPYSGVNVVSDNDGPMSIDFAAPAMSLGGYFTYLEPLTIDAFNASSILVASATSAFSDNDALFGDPGSSPNEFIQVSFTAGISSVTITGDPLGGSFTLDSATISTSASLTPEPDSCALLLLSGSILLALLRRHLT